ncbi:MAG: hypothetical protein Q8K28_00635 [Hoeflea sp.]|uniref:hypothetical protein n=1 Tax=Hoeflea sp. TaxID=1940281 RepID=UPI0027313B14|nr:hypothetical protein [Hoeflea sp.]MDP2118386.1 hypothetical protein [Hoeflea sp.]
MTLGTLLLRFLSPVTVIVAGFASATLLVLVFLMAGPSPWLFIALFAALGLVQGASFAAVPELNAALPDRALANGGIAQTGNIGNALGTPVLLAVTATGAAAGLPVLLIACYVSAIAVHLAMARSRAVHARMTSDQG